MPVCGFRICYRLLPVSVCILCREQERESTAAAKSGTLMILRETGIASSRPSIGADTLTDRGRLTSGQPRRACEPRLQAGTFQSLIYFLNRALTELLLLSLSAGGLDLLKQAECDCHLRVSNRAAPPPRQSQSPWWATTAPNSRNGKATRVCVVKSSVASYQPVVAAMGYSQRLECGSQVGGGQVRLIQVPLQLHEDRSREGGRKFSQWQRRRQAVQCSRRCACGNALNKELVCGVDGRLSRGNH